MNRPVGTSGWTLGRPTVPGLYWIWTEASEFWRQRDTSTSEPLVATVWRAKGCCEHCDHLEVYCYGGGGSMPVEMVGGRLPFLFLAIPNNAPDGGWWSKPSTDGWHLFRSNREGEPGIHLTHVSHGRGSTWVWRRGGSSSGGVEAGMYQPIAVPDPPPWPYDLGPLAGSVKENVLVTTTLGETLGSAYSPGRLKEVVRKRASGGGREVENRSRFSGRTDRKAKKK